MGRRTRTFIAVEFLGFSCLPPPPETTAAPALDAAAPLAAASMALAAATTRSTASSFASEMASARLDSFPSKVATMTKTRRTAGGGSDEGAAAAEDEEGGVEEVAATAASLACSKNASVPSRSTLQTEPSLLSKLRTPRAETAAEAPSQHPAIVAGSVTSPCQISAPSLERRAATAEEEEVAGVAEAAEADDGFSSFFGLTIALTRNLPLLTSSFTTWLPMWPVAPATTTSGRSLFLPLLVVAPARSAALVFVAGIDWTIDGLKNRRFLSFLLRLSLSRTAAAAPLTSSRSGNGDARAPLRWFRRNGGGTPRAQAGRAVPKKESEGSETEVGREKMALHFFRLNCLSRSNALLVLLAALRVCFPLRRCRSLLDIHGEDRRSDTEVHLRQEHVAAK